MAASIYLTSTKFKELLDNLASYFIDFIPNN